MSISEIESLAVLLKQSESERDEALLKMRQAEAKATSAQMQAEQLLGYRTQYHQRWSEQFAQRGTMEIVQCYQGFNDRLAEAIAQQNHAANHAGAQAAQARALLQEREMRVASVRKLIQRRQNDLRLAADRRDQKATDEAASRAGWDRNATSRMAGTMH